MSSIMVCIMYSEIIWCLYAVTIDKTKGYQNSNIAIVTISNSFLDSLADDLKQNYRNVK